MADGLVHRAWRSVTRAGAATPAGAASWLARPRAAARASVVLRSLRTVGAGVTITPASARLLSTIRPAGRLTPIVASTTRVAARSAARATPIGNAAPSRPQPTGAARIQRISYSLAHRSGVEAITQEAVAGRSDWASTANATGRADGVTATLASNALGARSGRLVASLVDLTGKTALTITSVRLRVHASLTVVALATGSLTVTYRASTGGADVVLDTRTATFDALATGIEYDLTAIVGGSWATLNALEATVAVSLGASLGSSAALDAIELLVDASAVQTF